MSRSSFSEFSTLVKKQWTYFILKWDGVRYGVRHFLAKMCCVSVETRRKSQRRLLRLEWSFVLKESRRLPAGEGGGRGEMGGGLGEGSSAKGCVLGQGIWFCWSVLTFLETDLLRCFLWYLTYESQHKVIGWLEWFYSKAMILKLILMPGKPWFALGDMLKYGCIENQLLAEIWLYSLHLKRLYTF